jgi:hypothetical protein
MLAAAVKRPFTWLWPVLLLAGPALLLLLLTVWPDQDLAAVCSCQVRKPCNVRVPEHCTA